MSSLANRDDLGEGVTVVKFFATWCRPCKLYAPVFERVASRNPGVHFHSVDVDQEPALKAEYNVSSVPMTIILKDGEEVGVLSGAQSTGRLDEAIKDVLGSGNANSP